MEEPKDSGETEEEESSDVEEEKSRVWADQVEEEESKPREDLGVGTEQKDGEKRREFVRGLRLWREGLDCPT